MNVTIDSIQKRFIIEACGTYSCLNFDTCYRDAVALSERLGLVDLAPTREEIGQLSQYMNYLRLMQAAQGLGRDLGTWYDTRTPIDVVAVLEWARVTHTCIRLFYGDANTGSDWLHEFDVLGKIGRDDGCIKMPVLVADGAKKGEPVFDHCILRILEAGTCRELYCHPLYMPPNLTLAPSKEGDQQVAVFDGERPVANFNDAAAANRWIGFMTGETMSL